MWIKLRRMAQNLQQIDEQGSTKEERRKRRKSRGGQLDKMMRAQGPFGRQSSNHPVSWSAGYWALIPAGGHWCYK